MPTHHRLDNRPLNNDVTTGQSGFVHDPRKSRTREPDEHFPKLPETDYHHDQDTNPGTHSPGPFHGDDLVSHGVTAPDAHSGGTNVDSYAYQEGMGTEDPTRLRHRYDRDNAVPVRVIDMITKERRITHQVLTSILVAPGTAQRILGKDPTRHKVFLQAAGTGLILVQPDFGPSGVAIAANSAFGFPIPTTTPLIMDTEDELWAYCATDVASPGMYVAGIAQYMRDTETLEEHFA